MAVIVCDVFARHHTNPVGTEWKWKMDDAETIFQGALKNHTNMIRQFKGTSGTIGKKGICPYII